jgi:transcriptional regulator with XRE-family HTH domain
MQNILNNIKAARAIKGYSQEDMANQLGIDYSTYGKIENGHSGLKVERLFEIAKILDLDIKRLFGIEKESVMVNQESSQPKIYIEIPVTMEDIGEFIKKVKQ